MQFNHRLVDTPTESIHSLMLRSKYVLKYGVYSNMFIKSVHCDNTHSDGRLLVKLNKHIGLFFGSFNPVHVGHLIIGNYMATQTDLDEVWLVVSPQNPLKNKSSLARDFDRLHLVRLAIEDSPNLKASNV